MAYRNFNIQTRKTQEQKWYWEVRPYGNPHPAKCHNVDDFLYETITISADKLVKSVETIWVNKDAFLAVLPPDVFEQPMFQEWHNNNGLTFTVEEDENFEHDPTRVGDNRIVNLD